VIQEKRKGKFLQKLQPLRKPFASGHSGWRITPEKASARRKILQPHPLGVCILRTDWFPNASKVLYPGICHRIAPL